ncbi:ABC transporter ATP-binding protein [Prevotella sp. tf2-5]|uniref:ABC transporter ATP-binding protein n=1 Tax=Prevotella sp. tf2-5 TaxID=1761889 RepID=UPI0008E980FD|nr:ABC transporter ATP-binding protein [Prevotella sp. tf2-5]SFO68168.1 ATP-binding cassette, subfamily B [Prevotella sp. tf2-5]
MIKTLYQQIRQYRTASLLTPAFTALEVLMDVLIPYVTASLIDKGINAGDMESVYFYGAVMMGMALLSLVFGILGGRCSAYAATGFAANLRSAMYRNIQRMAFSDIDKYATSGLVTRMTTDVNALQSAFQQIMGISVRAPFKLLLSILMCLVIDARLSLIFLIALVILSFSLYHIISRVARLFQQVFVKYDDLNQSVQENITGIRLVKAFVREDYENAKFAKAAENLYKLYVKAESLMAWNHPIMNMVVYGCIIALSWLGAHYIVEGTLTTGELTSLFTYVMSILMSLMMLSMVFVMLTQSAASAKRVAEIIEEEPDIVNPANGITTVPDGSIEFRGVRFDYQSKDEGQRSKVSPLLPHKRSALYNITFSIKSGETIGVIGGTGSGKSTLVNLISRLYDPREGEVCVGGHNVKDYDLTALRHAVSVVLQQNILFSGTVLDNLRWGNPDATLEECCYACQMAQADEFVSQMPEGYDTRIEQGGTNVSGGQKQRLCIARALLKHPKILVLDDSTSACDTATDAKIREAIHHQLPEMTKIIIAQRILSVRDCDRILVLDNGVVTGFDTHDNLLKTNTLYQEINAIQTENIGDFDA